MGGFCGTLWDICPCLLLMSLCRRWWISCRMSCSSWQRSCWWFPSWLSKCPRSCLSMSLCARPCALRSCCVSFSVRPVSVESPVVDMPVHGEHAGAARVRRERKMRSSWRHEQMAIQMVLAFGATPLERRSTEPEDSHQDRGRGTSCTARPSSGSASSPRVPASTSV